MLAPALDLSFTPWRRLMLSERRDIWCLVDAVDYDWIIEHNWNHGWHNRTPWKFYAKRNIGLARSTVYLHREVLLRVDPRDAGAIVGLHGDHINGQSLDNRRANLRWATPQQNRANHKARHEIPSLESILAKLMREAAADARQLADIPF